MKTFIQRNLLILSLVFMGSFAFGQSFNITYLDDTSTWNNSCDNVAELDFWVDAWGYSQTADHLYFISTNGILPGQQLLVTVNWGDGTSSNYTGIYQAPTAPLFAPGAVQHTYSPTGTINFPISVMVSNPLNNSFLTNSNFTFSPNCPTYFYGFVNVDCDSNGVTDSTIYSGVDMLITGANGYVSAFTTNAGTTIVSNLPSGSYSLAINPSWLIANGYNSLVITPSTFVIQGNFPAQITFQTIVICDSIPPPADGCVFGQVFCDNNNNGVFDSGEMGVYNAPVTIAYNNITLLQYTDPNGYYNFYAMNGNQDTAVVSVDANWLGQNGYQFTSNSTSLVIEPCQTSGNVSIANFPVNCDSAQVATECIIGWVFCDANGNGALDSGEVVIPNAPIQLSGNTNYMTTIYSDSNGLFSYSGQAFFGGAAILMVPQWWLTAHGYSSPNNVITVLTDCNNPSPVYIGINCSPVLCADLWTTVSPWIGYYQNQNNYIKLKWGNNGANTTTGYTLTLTYPSGVIPDLSSILYPNYVTSGNTITWTFGPGSSYIYNTDIIKFFVPSGYPSGTSHVYSSVITALGSTSDCNAFNNEGSLCMILGNSYDPNDKSVSHPTVIDPGTQDELTFVLRFQNTGTAPAQDVYIIDSLSTNLDWSTLKVISASHNMQLIDLGNGVMKFNFPGIWLPDSTTNEPASHGDVVFSIKENAINTVGSVIENTGYIYFDWNPAIITNTTFNVNAYLGLGDVKANEVSVYPNPFEANVILTSAKRMDNISVLDITGKVIFNEKVDGFSKNLDLSNVSQGTYLVRISSGSEVSIVRIVKK